MSKIAMARLLGMLLVLTLVIALGLHTYGKVSDTFQVKHLQHENLIKVSKVPHDPNFLLNKSRKLNNSYIEMEKHDPDDLMNWLNLCAQSANKQLNRYINNYSSLEKIFRIKTGRESHVSQFAFSPDGKFIAILNPDSGIQLFDVQTKEIQSTVHFEAAILNFTFSPDSKRIAAGLHDTTVRLWDIYQKKETVKLTGAHEEILNVSFSPDGKNIVSESKDNVTQLWNLRTGKRKVFWHDVYKVDPIFAQTSAYRKPCTKLAIFSPCGNNVVVVSNGSIRFFNLARGKIIREIFSPADISVPICFFPNGKQFGIISSRHDTHLYNAQSDERPEPIVFDKHSLRNISISPDGNYIVTTSTADLSQFSDIETGQPLALFSGFGRFGWDIAFSPDGKYFATTRSLDNAVYLWNMSFTTSPISASPGKMSVNCSVFHPDGKRIVSGLQDHSLRIWDWHSGKEQMAVHAHEAPVKCVAISPDGKHFASGSKDLSVRVWDTETGKNVGTFSGHQAAVIGVAFSPDGHYLSSASIDSTIILWDAFSNTNNTSLKRKKTGCTVRCLTFSPDGKQIVFSSTSPAPCGTGSSYDYTTPCINVWDLAEDSIIISNPVYNHAPRAISFNHSGNTCIVTTDNFSTFFTDDSSAAPVRKAIPPFTKNSFFPLNPLASRVAIVYGTTYRHLAIDTIDFYDEKPNIYNGNIDTLIAMWKKKLDLQ